MIDDTEIESIWVDVDKTIDVPLSQYVDEDRTHWKEVRVFVSSTFADYFAEREILVKTVFPKLRAWCQHRKLSLVEVDLRWGVPAESTSEIILNACLREIDRCRNTNVFPFFLNMLGHRYGWVPEEKCFPHSIAQQYNWIFGASVTQMEILVGAFRDNNPNALFMIRSDNYIQHLPSEFISSFIEPSFKSALKLLKLKSEIRKRFGPSSQVHDYDVFPSGVDDSSGMRKLKLSGLNRFGDIVFNYFVAKIDRQYPLSASEPTCAELYRNPHDIFAAAKSQVVVGRDDITNEIMHVLQLDSNCNEKHLPFYAQVASIPPASVVSSSKLLTDQMLILQRPGLLDGTIGSSSVGDESAMAKHHAPPPPVVVVLKARPGMGASTLLAHIASRMRSIQWGHSNKYATGNSVASKESSNETLLLGLSPSKSLTTTKAAVSSASCPAVVMFHSSEVAALAMDPLVGEGDGDDGFAHLPSRSAAGEVQAEAVQLAVRLCLELGNEKLQEEVQALDVNAAAVSYTNDVMRLLYSLWKESRWRDDISDTRPSLLIIDGFRKTWDFSFIQADQRRCNAPFPFPLPLPPQIKCLVSCDSENVPTILDAVLLTNAINLNDDHRVESSNTPLVTSISLEELGMLAREQIVAHNMALFNKVLSDSQMKLLLSNPGSSDITWLGLACEELRVFGVFEKIDEHIAALPSTVSGLLEMLLIRNKLTASLYVSESGGDSGYQDGPASNAAVSATDSTVLCLQHVLMLLLLTEKGLSEDDLRFLLGVLLRKAAENTPPSSDTGSTGCVDICNSTTVHGAATVAGDSSGVNTASTSMFNNHIPCATLPQLPQPSSTEPSSDAAMHNTAESMSWTEMPIKPIPYANWSVLLLLLGAFIESSPVSITSSSMCTAMRAFPNVFRANPAPVCTLHSVTKLNSVRNATNLCGISGDDTLRVVGDIQNGDTKVEEGIIAATVNTAVAGSTSCSQDVAVAPAASSTTSIDNGGAESTGTSGNIAGVTAATSSIMRPHLFRIRSQEIVSMLCRHYHVPESKWQRHQAGAMKQYVDVLCDYFRISEPLLLQRSSAKHLSSSETTLAPSAVAALWADFHRNHSCSSTNLHLYSCTGAAVRHVEEFPWLILKSKNFTLLREYIKTPAFMHASSSIRYNVLTVIRCPSIVHLPVLVPSSYQNQRQPVVGTSGSANAMDTSASSVRHEIICIPCSMKATFVANVLNRNACFLCGERIFSTIWSSGGSHSVRLASGESMAVKCRMHNPRAYERNPIFRMECVLCKLPGVLGSSAVEVVMCRACVNRGHGTNATARCCHTFG